MADEARHIKCAVHFVAIGVTMECKKELLLSESFFGHESLDLWRKVIQSLKNRGLTRVMTVITDDFSGLNKIVASLLPGCDHQLCLVHLMRNVRKNLDRKMYEDFSALIQKIYLCSSYDDAYSKFAEFVRNEVGSRDKKYANYLMERADNYLTFMKYPSALRPVIRSTNAVEGINNAIEIARRAAGGYFHSERELAVKLKIIFDSLKKEKWGIPIPRFAANLSEINRMFYERFEGEGMRVR
jgi:transposase-like protein